MSVAVRAHLRHSLNASYLSPSPLVHSVFGDYMNSWNHCSHYVVPCVKILCDSPFPTKAHLTSSTRVIRNKGSRTRPSVLESWFHDLLITLTSYRVLIKIELVSPCTGFGKVPDCNYPMPSPMSRQLFFSGTSLITLL